MPETIGSLFITKKKKKQKQNKLVVYIVRKPTMVEKYFLAMEKIGNGNGDETFIYKQTLGMSMRMEIAKGMERAIAMFTTNLCAVG